MAKAKKKKAKKKAPKRRGRRVTKTVSTTSRTVTTVNPQLRPYPRALAKAMDDAQLAIFVPYDESGVQAVQAAAKNRGVPVVLIDRAYARPIVFVQGRHGGDVDAAVFQAVEVEGFEGIYYDTKRQGWRRTGEAGEYGHRAVRETEVDLALGEPRPSSSASVITGRLFPRSRNPDKWKRITHVDYKVRVWRTFWNRARRDVPSMKPSWGYIVPSGGRITGYATEEAAAKDMRNHAKTLEEYKLNPSADRDRRLLNPW